MISPGTRLGPYEIVAAIGAGGMGEVFRARDPRLGRDVAIKILPAAVAADPERMRRFEQEARAAAALNHPNILAVYDVGHESAASYVVAELLDGQTLRDALAERGAVSIRRAIDYGIQVANGLAAAHEKGIVHRDLKPENLFITSDARVKILDFGLAKLTETAAAATAGVYIPTGSPTAPPPTEPGIVLGTVGYMSPEQVRGRVADHRSDIFSFGAVMYEVLSGRRAFVAESPAETMTAILRSDPPELATAERAISPALDRIVSRCLEKSPEARFQSAKDLAFALEAVSSSSHGAAAIRTRVPVGRRERLAWTFVAVLTIAVAAVAALMFSRPKADDGRILRFTVTIPEHSRLPTTPGAESAMSPDGRRLAFVTFDRGQTSIWVRDLDSFAARALPGTENGFGPFWSPDGRYLGFATNGGTTIKKIDTLGGPPVPLTEIPTITFGGGSWNQSGVILMGTSGGAIFRVSDQGGTATAVSTKDSKKGELAHRGPQFLPDGRHFLFFAAGPNEVTVGSLDGPERSVLTRADSRALYAPPGYLLFVRQGTMFAQKFDVASMKLSGEAVPVAEGILVSLGTNVASFSISNTGVLVYRVGRAAGIDRLTWFNRKGEQVGFVGELGDYQNPRLSPDGKQLAFSRRTGGGVQELWILDLNRGASTRLTAGSASGQQPVWSPDGSQVAYAVGGPGPATLLLRRSSGVGDAEALIKSDMGGAPDDWTPDGGGLLYHQGVVQSPTALMLLPLDGDRKPRRVVDSPAVAVDGRFSPDGKWLAYVSTESGRPEVYLQNFPTATAKWPISAGGGFQPVWRRDGRELFYLGPDGRLMAISLTLGDHPDISAPHPLFQTRTVGGTATIGAGIHHQYDVTSDGQKFLVLTAGETEESREAFNVVVNWPAALGSKK